MLANKIHQNIKTNVTHYQAELIMGIHRWLNLQNLNQYNPPY